MKSLGNLAAVSVPLIGIAIFYFTTPASPPPAPPKNRREMAAQSPPPALPGSPPAGSKPDGLLHGEELQRKLEEGMADVARIMTPERQRELVEAKMRLREPAYRSLFESWNLDASTSTEVLQIIREREMLMSKALQKHDEAGLAGGADYANARATEQNLADLQLKSLLGGSRFQELSSKEAAMRAAGSAKANRIINNIAED